jgi:hypothetical protein
MGRRCCSLEWRYPPRFHAKVSIQGVERQWVNDQRLHEPEGQRNQPRPTQRDYGSEGNPETLPSARMPPRKAAGTQIFWLLAGM